MKTTKRACLFVLGLVAFLLGTHPASATLYYDIDFSSPEHTVGQPPVTGGSITCPSQIVFGTPVVSSSLGPLKNQPLVFDSLGNAPSFYYDQIRLDMDRGTGFYYTGFDFVSHQLIGSLNHFGVTFDTHMAQNIDFKNDGKIDIFGGTQVNYQDDTLLHFDITMNIAARTTSVWINHSKVYLGTFAFPTESLYSIRFTHGLVSGIDEVDLSSSVGIDNILVADYVVPEPAGLGLLALGGMILRRIRRPAC